MAVWKILIMIAAIAAPNTPPRVMTMGLTSKAFKTEAACKKIEATEEFKDSINMMVLSIEEKTGKPIIIKTKCVDASKIPPGALTPEAPIKPPVEGEESI